MTVGQSGLWDSGTVWASVLKEGMMGFNVRGGEGSIKLDRFDARRKTRKLQQFENYNKALSISQEIFFLKNSSDDRK